MTRCDTYLVKFSEVMLAKQLLRMKAFDQPTLRLTQYSVTDQFLLP